MPKAQIIHYNPSPDMVLQIFNKVIAAQDRVRREKLAKALADETGHMAEYTHQVKEWNRLDRCCIVNYELARSKYMV